MGTLAGQINIGARTINEYRSEEGLDPVPWGDVYWAQSTLTPIEDAEKETNRPGGIGCQR